MPEQRADMPVRPGDLLAGGKYRVERILGSGGMGVVVAAKHLNLDQTVALKFVLPAALENDEAVERFFREARAAVRLQNEHVAHVLDLGRLESGAPYMVMELLEGSDLEMFAKRGPIAFGFAAELVLQACEGLAEAHALGIVHRDVKPRNLFITATRDGRPLVKVLDFGISKVPSGSAGDVALTRTQALMGSPLYMAPEQMRSSRDVDARADVWSLGVILYELLTGTAPFSAESLPEPCLKIATEAVPPLSSLRSDVPPGLRSVLACCLEKVPTRRYANAAELAAALRPFATDTPRGCRAMTGSTASVDTHAPWSDGNTPRVRGGASRHRWWPVAVLVVSGTTLTAAGLTFVWLTRFGGREPHGGAAPVVATATTRPPTLSAAPSAQSTPSTQREVSPTNSGPVLLEVLAPVAKAPASARPPTARERSPVGPASPPRATPPRASPAGGVEEIPTSRR